MSGMRLAALVLAAMCGWLAADPSRAARARLRRAVTPPGRPLRSVATEPSGQLTGRAAASARRGGAQLMSAAGALAPLLGLGQVGLPLLVAGVLFVVPAQRAATRERQLDRDLARDLPRLAELVATCLEAGLAPSVALQTAADAIDGPLADRLRPVAASWVMGLDVAAAWPSDGAELLRPLRRAFVRSAATGAPLAAAVAQVAAEARSRVHADADERARRAGVRAVGPLGLCFLPAFLLIGVVPVVVGMASQVTGQLL